MTSAFEVSLTHVRCAVFPHFTFLLTPCAMRNSFTHCIYLSSANTRHCQQLAMVFSDIWSLLSCSAPQGSIALLAISKPRDFPSQNCDGSLGTEVPYRNARRGLQSRRIFGPGTDSMLLRIWLFLFLLGRPVKA